MQKNTDNYWILIKIISQKNCLNLFLPNIVVQRCIVHLIRNSIRYILSKNYKKFTQILKKFMMHQV
ncbi:MAG: hypothetical protein DBY41_06275 [Clostridium sp.]|nr:MAG: hypothetical protein DBY41_06275 [Clostridium sp.]